MASWTTDPRAWLLREAPWLAAPELGAAIVGSAALAEACRRNGASGPRVGDLDLAWALAPEAAERTLREHGVFQATTEHNRARGTLAAKLGGMRLEITSYRGPDASAPLHAQLDADLALRDMTVGALAWRIADDTIVDPLRGLSAWQERRVVACGDPAARIREHPIRLLRYYRRAHEWGFDVDVAIRRVQPVPAELAKVPREALAQEVRAMLLRCRSPGRCLHELAEIGVLALLVPELAPGFDGRPAGPLRHHPEVSQALHTILALEWAVDHARELGDEDRLALLVAVLCHDLGKHFTPREEWPSHHGHPESGLAPLATLLESLPGLTTSWSRRLAESVCALHVLAHELGTLRPGTLASLHDRWFRAREFRVDLFALAVGADTGGRLGLADAGLAAAARVERQVTWIRERCDTVDAAALRERYGTDVEKLRAAIHEARARTLTSGFPA